MDAASLPASDGGGSTVDRALQSFHSVHGRGPGADVAIVIAAFNEEPSVGSVVAGLPGRIDGSTVECLVVDDGSSDRTAEQAVRAGALVCRFETNLGQGAALRAGYRLAGERGARVVVTMDADGQFDPQEIGRLVAPVLEGRADFVNGSRRLGRSFNRDLVRSLGVQVFGLVVSLAAGCRITDPANGFRAFRTDLAEGLDLRQSQYQTAETLIAAAASGARIVEAPVTVLPRHAGESKKGGNLRYGLAFARVVAVSWWHHRVRRRPHRISPAPNPGRR